MQVPFLDLRVQYQQLQAELLPELTGIMERGAFIGGPALRDFEAAFAAYCGAAHAVGVANGTDALELACRAAGLGPGDEVITAANTFVATVEAIVLAGATPVLVDMDPSSYHLDIAQVEAAITPRTRALMPVHLYGDPVDMDPLLAIAARHGLVVIEDAAQAHGARYKGRRCGSLAPLAGFSFYPGKNLGAYGDGGAVLAASAAHAQAVREIGDHGSPRKYHHARLGTNSRLDALQAAVLRVKLAHLDAWNAARRRVAAAYRERLSGVGDLRLPVERPGHEPVYHLFVIRSARIPAIAASLQAGEIGFGYHYPQPVHRQPAFEHLGRAGRFPEAERGAAEILSLPMYAELSEAMVERVCAAVRAAFSG
ncbi:DegT/DnrJ/EryC1/StrS family aminotransferase [bacterium]|nr:DegT/DnrJ/EryC1/StrS family aminotransferase [bacterium]